MFWSTSGKLALAGRTASTRRCEKRPGNDTESLSHDSSCAGLTRASINLQSASQEVDGLPGQAHERPARFVLEEAHGIDSTRFQLVTNHLDTKRDQRRAASEYRFSWTSEAYSVVDPRSACGSVRGRLGWPRRKDQSPSDRDAVCAVLRRTESARD